jgi:phosphatidylglycerol:prolipoprotein diacylglycerol transferase
MITLNWNPLPYVGPIPLNWYGLGFAAGAIVAGWLVFRWAARLTLNRTMIEQLLVWIMAGVVVGARVYYVMQNDFSAYLQQPWRILMVWEGGLAYFGGFLGGIGSAYLYCQRHRIPFLRIADLFAPAIPIGSAIGRISCGLDGMDYGTPTALPWGVVYIHPASYAPLDGIPRHPDQYYELVGDLLIAGVLLRLRGRFADGTLFLSYLIAFSVLRFFIFFVRGNVPAVALGMKNGQWTALVILAFSVPALVHIIRSRKSSQPLGVA